MNLRHETIDGIQVLTIEGRLDATSADQFQNGVLSRVGRAGQGVLIDLEPLSYLSSAGIRSILMIARDMQDHNRNFALCSPKGDVAEVLSVSGVDSIVTVHDRRDDAVSALK